VPICQISVKPAGCQHKMARPAAIWQTVDSLQQPATRNRQIRKVHGLSPTAPSGQRRRLRAVYSPILVSEAIGAEIHKYSINAVNQSNSVTCRSHVAGTQIRPKRSEIKLRPAQGIQKKNRPKASSRKWGTCYFSVLAPGPTIFKLPPKASSTG